MNYLKIGDKKYNLTDDGIQPQGNDLMLVVCKENYSFDDVFATFQNVGDELTVYDTVTNTDVDGEHTEEFVSGSFVGYTHLKAVEYSTDEQTYKINLVIPDETENRLNDLENAVNALIMGGE